VSPPADGLDSDGAAPGFGPGVSAKLQSYVYLLVDPRTGRPFFVGRGRDDRCFRHVRAARVGSDPGPTASTVGQTKYPMLDRIREVESGGRQVRIDILRFGLSPDEALLVEAAVNDAFGFQPQPKLGSQRQSAVEVGALLAKRAKFKRVHQVVLLRVGGTGADHSYEVARHGWRIGRNWTDLDSARSPRWAVMVVGNLVAAVHRIERWEPTQTQAQAEGPTPPGEQGPVRVTAPSRGGDAGAGKVGGRSGRYSFAGPHDPELERRYGGKSVAAYLGTGPASPITYVWCGPHWVNTPP
jgi:uncharacterized protein